MSRDYLKEAIETIRDKVDDRLKVYETIGSSRVLLTAGWYTIDQLKSMVSCLERMNEQAKASMGVPNE